MLAYTYLFSRLLTNMPTQTPSASDYTSVVKSAAVANDLASKPAGSAAAAKSARSIASGSGGSLSLGTLSSILTQSTVIRSIIPRPITSSAIPLPIPETGLTLWIDAGNLSSMVFGNNISYGAGSYQQLTSIKDGYKGTISSTPTGSFRDPVYIPSVNSTFLSNTGLTDPDLHPTATNKPAFYFRNRGTGTAASHTWTINQVGNPLTMFAVWHCAIPVPPWGGSTGGGVGFSSTFSDSTLMGYDTAYDVMFFSSKSAEGIDLRQKPYSSYKKPVIQTLGNRMSGATKQVFMRFNQSEVASRTVTPLSGNEWYHNPSGFRTGRGNEIAEMLVYEVIIYNTIMTPSDIEKVETYLKTKWGL